MGLLLTAVTLMAARSILQSWWMGLVLLGLIGAVLGGSLLARRHAVRSAMPTDGSARVWLCRLHPTFRWIWEDLKKPRGWSFDDGIPAEVRVGSEGLEIALRGRTTRSNGRRPVLIPWAEVAGARAHDRGHRWPSGTSFSPLRLTEVTVDVVGPSAEEWVWPGGPPGHEVLSDAELRFAAMARAELPGWRPGTAPLVLVAYAAPGLVEAVEARAAADARARTTRPPSSLPD